jgi:hypothetical protein
MKHVVSYYTVILFGDDLIKGTPLRSRSLKISSKALKIEKSTKDKKEIFSDDFYFVRF